MIQLKEAQKRYGDVPNSLEYSIIRSKIEKIVADAPNHIIKSVYNSDEVRQKLRLYHGEKCVYCESIPISSSVFRVDHFRPKKYIKDVAESVHFGYYWLSLEWTNLLQCCDSCNSRKSNQFPVKNEHVNAILKEALIISESERYILSPTLKRENRLLLHPELDAVEKHLVFNGDGSVSAFNDSDMGKKSIEVYDLNRGGLIIQRKKKIDYYFYEIVDIFNDFEDGGGSVFAKEILFHDLKKFFKKILNEQSEEKEFSRLGFYMFHDFTKFFVNRLPVELTEYKDFLLKYYSKLRVAYI